MSFSKFASLESIVHQNLIKHGFKVTDIINEQICQLKIPLQKLFENVENDFIKKDPHSQRPEAWNKDNIDRLIKDFVLPIFNNSKSVSILPDLIFAMCDEYKYDLNMYKLCLIDGGNRLRNFSRFCNVEPFTHGKKRYNPCIEIDDINPINGQKIKVSLYFKETEFTKKEILKGERIRYLTKEQQNKLLNFEITAKLSFHVHSFQELNDSFNGFQNSKPISKNSSEYLKNLDYSLANFCLRNSIYDKMYNLTNIFINSTKFCVHITGMFYLLYIGNKTNFSKKSVLDIISNDDKNLSKRIRTSVDINKDFNGSEDDFKDFESKINMFEETLFTVFKCSKNNTINISMIMFKTIFLNVLTSNDHKKIIKCFTNNQKHILSNDKIHNKNGWYGKSNDEGPIELKHIQLLFESNIEFINKIINNPTKIIKIKPSIVSKITSSRKSTHNTAEYRKEREKVIARDFGNDKTIYCRCCNQRSITVQSFECGHIIPRSEPWNGPDKKENMIAICSECNSNGDYGMGTQNLFEFQEKFYSNAPSAREYMNKMNYIDDMNNISDINNKIDISNFTTQELKNLAKRYKKSTSGSRQDIYNRIRSEL